MIKKLHKALAWSFGIWLMLVCASGSILLFKNELLMWQYHELKASQYEVHSTNNVNSELARLTENFDKVPHYQYVIYANEASPWHIVVDTEANHHYFNQSGELLLTRAQRSDAISWLREFHMHLVLHDIGEDLLGILSLVSMVLIIAGFTLWYPKHLSIRVFIVSWRKGSARAFRQWHSVIGVVSLPLLLIIMITSAGLLYFNAFKMVLVDFIDNTASPAIGITQASTPTITATPKSLSTSQVVKWQDIFVHAKETAPDANFRFVSLQQNNIKSINLRMKFPEEWHPNGRTSLTFDGSNNTLLSINSARDMGGGETLLNMLYPIHIASIGGIPWLWLLAFTGLLPSVMMYLGWRYSHHSKRHLKLK